MNSRLLRLPSILVILAFTSVGYAQYDYHRNREPRCEKFNRTPFIVLAAKSALDLVDAFPESDHGSKFKDDLQNASMDIYHKCLVIEKTADAVNCAISNYSIVGQTAVQGLAERLQRMKNRFGALKNHANHLERKIRHLRESRRNKKKQRKIRREERVHDRGQNKPEKPLSCPEVSQENMPKVGQKLRVVANFFLLKSLPGVQHPGGFLEVGALVKVLDANLYCDAGLNYVHVRVEKNVFGEYAVIDAKKGETGWMIEGEGKP